MSAKGFTATDCADAGTMPVFDSVNSIANLKDWLLIVDPTLHFKMMVDMLKRVGARLCKTETIFGIGHVG